MSKIIKAIAGVAAGMLLMAGCSPAATEGVVPVANADTQAATASSVASIAVVEGELTYADLAITEADLEPDVADATHILLADGSSGSGQGYAWADETLTITAGGTYVLSGQLSAGRVVVNAGNAAVTLVLDGVDIASPDTGAIWVAQAEHVVVYLAEGSENTLSDASGAVVDESDDTAPTGTLFSADDLWIAGPGSLSVDAVANDGIVSKDSLIIADGHIEVTSQDDGIRGKDHLAVRGGSITVTAVGQGFKSDDEDVVTDPSATVGVVWIEGGEIDITSETGDAINAVRQVTIAGGDLTLASGDDGVHVDGILRIAGGAVKVTESYEGLEASVMLLSGGEGNITASDDGVNVAGGIGEGDSAEDATGDMARPDQGRQGMGGPGGMGGAGDDGLNASRYLEITGGTWIIDAQGDGIDVNGKVTHSAGTVVVTGPSADMNGALDADNGYELSGGVLAASGSAGMLVVPEVTGEQGVLVLSFASVIPAGTVLSLADEEGLVVASFITARESQALVFSSPDVMTGQTYTVLVDGVVSGEAVGPLTLGGALSGGEELGALDAV